jgi:hypothetical protein
MRSLTILSLSLAAAVLACSGVLKIDNTYESVPEAYCADLEQKCTGVTIEQTSCVSSIAPESVSHQTYFACIANDAGCSATVTCFNQALASTSCSDRAVTGRPCTSSADCCASRGGICSADGGVGTCK